MIDAPLMFLLYALLAAFVVLFGLVLVMKIGMTGNARREAETRLAVIRKIEAFVDAVDLEFAAGLDEFAAWTKTRGDSWLDAVDNYLLYVLEMPEAENRERYLAIARRLGLAAGCQAQIGSRNLSVSAAGARRAGLYRCTDAAEDMITALDFPSSENEFEILMGLARLGRADALERAIDKIKKNVLVNERAIFRILGAFPGGDEKKKLFRDMIRDNTDYIAALFLKSVNREMAAALKDDIREVLASGSKDLRAAAIRALTVLGKDAPAAELVAAMADHDWEIRALAAKALENVRTPESSMALYRGLFDLQWWVRQNAASSLSCHPGHENLFILAAESGDEYTKDSIIYALENRGSPLLLRSIKLMVA